ncbi:unnamed protein product, partial [marine sediment metagenome]
MTSSHSGIMVKAAAALFILVLSLALFPVPFAQGQPSALRIWAVSDCDKILRYESPWDSSSVWSQDEGVVNLRAARNEYVAFQVMITAEGGDLVGVNASFADLRGQNTNISSGNIQLFREHYLHVTEPSTSMYGEQSTTGPGWYPDPLVPL